MESAGGPPAGSPAVMWQGIAPGAGTARCPAEGPPFGPAVSHGGASAGRAMQLAGGGPGRAAIAAGTGAGAACAGRKDAPALGRGAGMGVAAPARGPVYTQTADGGEEIVYRSSEMDEGRLYAVEWNGGHYALRKSGDAVEIFEFVADGSGGRG